MLAIIHGESIARVIIFFIVLFIACVFWVSYYRIRSFKLLLTSVAFTLLLTKPILHHTGHEGYQMHVLDIIVFSFIAVSFYRRRNDDKSREDETCEIASIKENDKTDSVVEGEEKDLEKENGMDLEKEDDDVQGEVEEKEEVDEEKGGKNDDKFLHEQGSGDSLKEMSENEHPVEKVEVGKD